MARGGARIGSGRKPKARRLHAVHGTTPETSTTTSSTAPAAPIEPPKGLTTTERAVWQCLAPQATAAGTLVPATAADFRELVRLHVHVERTHAEFLRAGWNEYGLKLERAYRGAVQRLEAKMRAFRLAPIGKEIAPPADEKPQTAFERLQADRAKLTLVRQVAATRERIARAKLAERQVEKVETET